MDLVGIIIFLLIGAIAGWLAGQIMKGGSFGCRRRRGPYSHACKPATNDHGGHRDGTWSTGASVQIIARALSCHGPRTRAIQYSTVERS